MKKTQDPGPAVRMRVRKNPETGAVEVPWKDLDPRVVDAVHRYATATGLTPDEALNDLVRRGLEAARKARAASKSKGGEA